MKLLAWLLLMFMWPAHATPVALDDGQLAAVDGRDGVVVSVHLEVATAGLENPGGGAQLIAGFQVNGQTTYAVVQGLGGVIDLFSITLDIRNRSDGGGSYLDVGLPGYIGIAHFGFRALGAQTDPQAPVTAATSYGQVLLNGTAAATGHIYLWAAQ
jgi:hypothetical protein